jgi:L-lactate dehydrogenase
VSRSRNRTVAIVGVGSVGVAAAYALFTRRAVSQLLLVDQDPKKAEGEAMDLMHGQALVGRVSVRAARYDELGEASVVVVAAGRNQKRGESRLDLLRGNAEVIRSVMSELDRHAPDAIVIIATNPVDVLTRLAIRASTRAAGRVFGTGTTLDSARFRALLGEAFGVSPRSIHAHVLGEHGDSQVAIWSTARVGGASLDDEAACGRALDDADRKSIEERTRGAARAIIERKGRTDLAIGTVIAHLVGAVLGDERSVQPLSVPLEGEYGLADVCLGIPCVLGRDGVTARIVPALSADELAALTLSADTLRAAERDAGLAAPP